MTSEFDIIQTLIDYLMEHPDDSRAWFLLSKWVNALHSFAHELGRGNIKVKPEKYQTDHFIQVFPDSRFWDQSIRKFLREKGYKYV